MVSIAMSLFVEIALVLIGGFLLYFELCLTSMTKIMLNLQLNGYKCKSFQGFSLTILINTR